MVLNVQKMMQQAQQMQQKLQELQEKFKDIIVEGQAGGNLVKVVMSCDGRVRSISVDESVQDDKETLEDLLVVAVNSATEAREAKIQDETKTAMESMGLPADTPLPF